MQKYVLTDGTKSAALEDLPEEAWVTLGGDKPAINIDKLYASVAFLYRCVDMRANAIASLPWYIMRGDTMVWSHAEEDAPPELLFAEHLPDLLWQTEAAMSLGAQAFWLKEMNRVKVRELRWLAPWTIDPIWEEEAGLVRFDRRLKNRKIAFAPDRIVYIRLPGQHETKPRTSPGDAAMSAAGVIYNVDTFAKLFFERGAIKATLLTVEGNPLPEERDRLKRWWKRVLTGLGQALNVEVVSAGVKPVIIGDGIAELSNTELAREKREDIATALGVPHSMVVSNASNFATAQVDRRSFYESTVVPASVVLQRQINRQLFNDMGLRFEFRPQELDVFQEEENERADAFQKYVSAGLKRSIVVQMLGIELPDGIKPEDLDDPVVDPTLPTTAQPVGVPVTAGASVGTATQAAPSKLPAKATEPEVDMAREVEIQVFKRWMKKRKNPDPSQFNSGILSDADKAMIVDAEGGAAENAFFRGIESYP